MPDYEEEITFFVPVNFNEPNNIFLGLLNTNRIIQIVPLAIPILLVVISKLLLWIKIVLIVVLALIAIFGLIGYKNMGLIDFFLVIYSYIKNPKNYTMKRIEIEGGSYAKARSRQRRRKTSQVQETKAKKGKKARKK